MKKEKIICCSCNKEVNEVCGDGFCRECHVSLSFEDCVNGTWVARMNMEGFTKAGMAMGFSEEKAKKDARQKLKELYPAADI